MTSNKTKKRLTDFISDNFKDLYKAWKNDEYTRYVLKGGRGSAKSSHIAIILVLEIIK